LKVITIIGTRPEFIQIGPLTKSLRRMGHTEILVNTGQHYDDNMSQIFFRELDLPQPDINLEVGSGSHARQTGQMMMKIEDVLLEEKPDYVVVYGDTNSTVAGALVAAKLHIPIVHVESGLRSYDRRMPEEINRVTTDHLSNIMFAPTDKAIKNLMTEGIVNGVYNVGDVRVDVLADLTTNATERLATLSSDLNLPDGDFIIATIHRAENTDDATRLRNIVEIFNHIELPVVLPVHPRLRKMMTEHQLTFSENVYAIDPVGFLDMVTLLHASKIVITDSGGLQKESYMMKRPTITLRDSTEWIETVDSGWNRLCEPDQDTLKQALSDALNNIPETHPSFYGEYGVGERMVKVLVDALDSQ